MRPLVLALLVGCGPAAPEIAGSWRDPGGIAHEIDARTWRMTATGFEAVYHLVEVDDAAAYLLAWNDEGNPVAPGRASRFDWTGHRGAVWFCHTVFDAEDLEAARAGQADRTDPDTGGCGGFPWTELVPEARTTSDTASPE